MKPQAPLLLLSLLLPAAGSDPTSPSWLVYYSDQAPISAFSRYELLVLDSDFHPPLAPLKAAGKTLLGYISLGEVENHRSYFESVRKQSILLEENPNWPGSFFVDLRGPLWPERVLDELVPAILERGFDGLFLDTIDNAAYLEQKDPASFKGMTAASADLVRALRQRFPKIPIMLNRGYEILPEVAGHIDMVLGESVLADYDFESKSYRLVAHDLYREQVKMLQSVRRKQPRLQIMTLDYWDPADSIGIEKIYRVQQANGFNPYVATVELDRIIPRPIQ